MKPLFFGSSDHQLYGVYHPAVHVTGVNGCLLLCPPIGLEYMRTHWAFKQLANQLAKAGLHVLRFDYSGCGNSIGGAEVMSVARWIEDLHVAAEELLALSGSKKLSLVGLRFGGSLAALASSKLNIENLLLWDPVMIGKEYMEQLELSHQAMLVDSDRFNIIRETSLTTTKDELVGFPYPALLCEAIKEIDLNQAELGRVKQTFLLTADELSLQQPFVNHVQQMGVECHLYQQPATADWIGLPNEAMQLIKELSTRCTR